MDKITDKQMDLMDKLGIEYDEAKLSKQEASRLIDEKLNAPKMNGKVLKEPQREFVEASGYHKSYGAGDKASFYVAYSKDLCIAMLQSHVEARKIDPKIEIMSVESLMHEAIRLIHLAKRSF